MAEEISYNNYASEDLVARLYYFKEAAAEYLEPKSIVAENSNDAILERMFGRYTYLVHDLAPAAAEQKLKRAVEPLYDLLLKSQNREFVKQQWFRDNVDAKTLADMVALIKSRQEFVQKRDKLLQKSENNTLGAEAVNVLQDSREAQLFKAEISQLIQRSRKYGDEDKAAMLSALASTAEISYTKKKGQMTYSFSGYELIGFVTDGTTDMRNRAGQKIYSTCEQFDKEFAKTLKSRGKIRTAYGETAKQAADATKKEDKKQADIKKQVAEIDVQLGLLETKQQAQFEKLVKSLSPQFLIADMANSQGVLAGIAEKSQGREVWENARKHLISVIYTDKAVWSAYMPPKNSTCHNQRTRFDDEVEKAFSRHNERDKLINAGREFYREFEKLATDDKKQFNATRIDDDMLKKLFQRSVAMVTAVLPLGVRQEALRQEIFRQAMSRGSSTSFDVHKFQMMNRLLMLDGMKIEFSGMKIENKVQTDSARFFSDAILADMWQGNKVANRHKTEAFLYHLGEYRQQHAGEKLNDVDAASPHMALFHEFSDVFYGQNTRYSIINPRMKSLWAQFITDTHNLKQADAMYQMLHKTKVPGVRVCDAVEKLARGMGLNDDKSLMQQSKHHFMYRRFAGFYGDSLETLKELFNAPEHIVDTIALHPALKDVHKDMEHRFDMGEEYLYKKPSGEIVFGSYSRGEVGDELLVPTVCVKNDKDQFEPLMKEDILVMSSAGKVMAPHIPDKQTNIRQIPFQGITFE